MQQGRFTVNSPKTVKQSRTLEKQDYTSQCTKEHSKLKPESRCLLQKDLFPPHPEQASFYLSLLCLQKAAQVSQEAAP